MVYYVIIKQLNNISLILLDLAAEYDIKNPGAVIDASVTKRKYNWLVLEMIGLGSVWPQSCEIKVPALLPPSLTYSNFIGS